MVEQMLRGADQFAEGMKTSNVAEGAQQAALGMIKKYGNIGLDKKDLGAIAHGVDSGPMKPTGAAVGMYVLIRNGKDDAQDLFTLAKKFNPDPKINPNLDKSYASQTIQAFAGMVKERLGEGMESKEAAKMVMAIVVAGRPNLAKDCLSAGFSDTKRDDIIEKMDVISGQKNLPIDQGRYGSFRAGL